MIVLDTNVVSALMRTPRDPAVLAWLDGQPAPSLWITSITVLEIRFGIERLAKGWRQAALSRAFTLSPVLRDDLEERVLGFGAAEAAEAAALLARRHVAGRPAGANDGMMAGIVRVHRATLATRNVRHFADAGIGLVDPWEARSICRLDPTRAGSKQGPRSLLAPRIAPSRAHRAFCAARSGQPRPPLCAVLLRWQAAAKKRRFQLNKESGLGSRRLVALGEPRSLHTASQ